ncbi:MAG: EscR/YscR/HrcR family type III secretion system export apparatus protein [Sulfitobacter sp.]|nr:EscR/YscR/HrcR family type III secretion system export apparatus protein [Sulfitobacter sp.]
MSESTDPLLIMVSLALLGLAPFLAMMTTSFVKLAVVISLIRNALGVQQIPPNMALYGLALIITLYIMAPVGIQAYDSLAEKNLENLTTSTLLSTVGEAAEPFRGFLDKHATAHEKAFFVNTAKELWPEKYAKNVTRDSFLVLIPAFTVSELTAAFEIGFLLYLPFIVIDLIISNILLAMGMMMVSPMTISLPFKLLLFVLVDGWTRLIHGLVLSYQ